MHKYRSLANMSATIFNCAEDDQNSINRLCSACFVLLRTNTSFEAVTKHKSNTPKLCISLYKEIKLITVEWPGTGTAGTGTAKEKLSQLFTRAM